MTSKLDLQMDEMKEMIEDFLVEADELVVSLDGNFVRLEAAPGDLDLLNEIFRAAHTIKGTSSFVGFEQVTTLTHQMEDILNKLRKSEMTVTAEVMDVLLSALDTLKVLLDKVRQGDTSEQDLSEILGRLSATLDENEKPGLKKPSKRAKAARAAGTRRKKDTPAPAAEVTLNTEAGADALKKVIDTTIRVDVERIDALMNMVGELVLGRNSLVQTISRLQAEHDDEQAFEPISQAAAAVNFITTELQMAVMKMRMQPVGKVISRLPRLVRDLARDHKKQVELFISGANTEVDKSVIEEIGDPLVHILRNSCDHGIESPEERVSLGKPAAGAIRLEASQEGSNIVIKVHDDGRGLDADAIRAKAVERGVASPSELERMADRDVYKFIFTPGFSTAKVVTNVSGRGVGMDVVRSNIEKLNGLIELESAKGRGTTVTIKLPLTLAIIQGLLVQCEDEIFILPLSSVIETVKTEQSEIHYMNKRPVLSLRDEVIPVVNLGRLLRHGADSFILAERPYIVIVGLAEKKLGVIVDRFLGQEEVVIKSLGSYLGSAEGIAGATILGDGRIRLIVDIIGLFGAAARIC